MAASAGAGQPLVQAVVPTVVPVRRAGRRNANLQRGRDIDRALTALSWTSDDGSFTSSLRVQSGTAVISLAGHLGRSAMAVCRSALEAAIRIRPAHLIVDLGEACTDEDSAGLLTLMVRSAVRHGIAPQLTDVPCTVQAQLTALAPAGSFEVHQNLPVALRVVTGVARPVAP